jgi:hypothetical protein
VRPRVERPVIALVDVGAVAYDSEWFAIDTFGLNDATIARTGRRDGSTILSRDPTILVVLSAEEANFVAHLPWEAPLVNEAERQGFRVLGNFEFAPDYYLRVLAKGNDLDCGQLGCQALPEEHR